ncbi:hypothetical protein ABIE09_004587 [Lysobacter enzymogenes]|uniref:XVIPCD domain-containing protein n=1 Tax=Lysobacter enzymogenes TaxID=69 RepID=UPI00339122AE
MAGQARQYTAADLYGADGRPHWDDIRQDEVYDCYFLAPLGALGERQPDRIRDAIAFDPRTQEFTVTLYRPPNEQERGQGRSEPIRESVVVSQDDIRNNLRRDGGGVADNNRDGAGPLWPTVMEAGFAELYGRNERSQTDLGRGYRTIGAVTGGGALADGIYAVTGEPGRNVRIADPDAPAVRPTGPNHVARSEPPPFHAPATNHRMELDTAYNQVEQALAAGRPVTLATQGREVNDGLEESHAYMVVDVKRDPATNEARITLRNPYGNNQRAQEGNHNIGGSWNANDPVITVALKDLTRAGSLAEFNIGPAPRVQSQQPAAVTSGAPAQPGTEQAAPAGTAPPAPVQPAPTPPGSSPAARNPAATTPAPAGAPDITRADHPGHERFQQAVTAIERSPNIPPGTFTGERLQQAGANLAYASLAGAPRPQGGQNEHLDRIDFAVFNNDRSGLIAGQGAIGDSAVKLAFLPSAQDHATPLVQASQQVQAALAQRQAQTQGAEHAAPAATLDEPTPKAPRL